MDGSSGPNSSQNRKIVYLKDSLPDCVSKIHGNGRSDLEDLAFLSHPPREADEIGRRVCLRSSGQWIAKTRRFCPSEPKTARFQASLSSPFGRGTMPAQPSIRFSPPTALRLCFEEGGERMALKI